METTTKKLSALLAALVLAGGIAACGDERTAEDIAGTGTEETAEAGGETGGAESGGEVRPAEDVDVGEISTDTSQKPEIETPSGDAPPTLVTRDVVEGEGATAEAGDLVTVQYVGVSFSNGEQFDASWDRGEPFTFTLGAGEVIQGWDQGVAGMQEGGRRLLVIPPDLAYGEAPPPGINPNETLVFVVDLVSVGEGGASIAP